MNTLQRPLHFLKRISLVTLLAFLINGCFAPAIVADRSGCQLVSKKLELVHFEEGSEVLMQIASSSDCHNAECLLFILIGVPVISATSFIVSGSIVVIGNTLHWIEKQGKCDDSGTQTIINSMINAMKALGGKTIQTASEFMSWLTQQ
ncbi:MAG: hypothetical protein DRR16_28730 [Candidatus Parabeggiatoa sp. nov. 3]|nr:MAG: hypothetical protein DRR00_25910 [Gammaproteobacteria bacterium]RKZ59015.1 MAG: hypothetical protein DRQ99_24505 [Gammaproteobacteria bacterium]RKZ77930.1 MAG: hypothetical protein DRR16_28730 [Gammaproteobacteria bacterium]HEW97980.1 hypothetical protein [Beggiatoa sp.]